MADITCNNMKTTLECNNGVTIVTPDNNSGEERDMTIVLPLNATVEVVEEGGVKKAQIKIP